MGFKVSPGVSVIYPELDIANAESIQNFASSIKRDCSAVSVLINNAGVNLDDQYSPETVKTTLDTNVRGTLRVSATWKSVSWMLINLDVRGVSPSSYQGWSHCERVVDWILSQSIQQRESGSFPQLGHDIRRSRKDDAKISGNLIHIDHFFPIHSLTKRQASASSGTETQAGWPQHSYSVSKACINALTAVLARKYPGLVINACCPGWVSTDMGKMVGSTPPKSSSRLSCVKE